MSTDPHAAVDQLHADGALTDEQAADAHARVDAGTPAHEAVAQAAGVTPQEAQDAINLRTEADEAAQEDAAAEHRAQALAAAAELGHNAEPSEAYDPVVAASAVVCPHCGTAVPGAVLADGPPPATEEVT